MRNFLRICFLFLALIVAKSGFSQTITIGSSFNVGPYGRGSSITVPIQLSGIFNTDEKFEIYLSDASGSFASATKIGDYTGFYSTFVNGIIPPATLAGLGYKIEVRATKTGVIIATTPPFSVINTSGVAVVVTTSNATELRANEVFGRCTPNNNFISFNATNTTGSVSIKIKNETTGVITNGSVISSPSKTHYTITVTIVENGVTSTRSYFFINNDNVNPLRSNYRNPICINSTDPSTGVLDYQALVSSGADIYLNFPGDTYQIKWDDGGINNYTSAQIIQANGIVSHKYASSSCGSSVTSGGIVYYNSFGTQSKVINPYCPEGNPTIDIAQVFEMPNTEFTGPTIGCVNSPLTFINTSTQGVYGNQTKINCSANNILYDWYVDGNRVLANKSYTVNLNYTFTTSGTHTIILVPIDPNQNDPNLSIPCMPDAVTKEICIEQTPVPDFKFLQGTTELETIKGCAPLSIAIKDKSNILNSCSNPVYTWVLTNLTSGLSGFAQNNNNINPFINGTNANSLAPEFIISTPGNYALKLIISNNCAIGGISKTKNFTVVGPPIISNFNYPITYCETLPKQVDFNNQTYNANFAPVGDVSYNWTITGGSFDYVGGTSSTAAAPKISFKSYGTYTVTLDYTNGCGTDTKTQNITFNQPLSVDIAANASATNIDVCTNTVINLSGNLSGPSGYTYVWEKSTNAGGTLTPGPINSTNPTATYTPIQTDDDKQLTFTLRVSYPIPVPSTCAFEVSKSIKVTYTATNTATASTKKICTNTAVAFTPTSTIANSQFIWTVVSSGANTAGFNNQTTYTSNPINDILTNSGNATETVVYQITPRSPQGCAGTPFNLTVSVVPSIAGNTISSDQTICAGQIPNLIDQSGVISLSGGDNSTFVYQWEQQEIGQSVWTTALGTLTNLVSYQPPALVKTTTYRRKVYSPDLLTCVNISIPVTITVNPLPVIVYSSVPDICNTSSTFNLPFSSSQNNPIKYSISAGTRAMAGFVNVSDVDFTTSPILVAIPVGVAQGTYDFNIKVKNANGCESVLQTIALNVKTPPTIANAGSDQAKCQTGTFTLAANAPTSGSGTWTIIGTSNGASITLASNRSTTITGLQVGKNVVLRWTIANGPCSDSYDEVLLTNEPATTIANAGTAIINCDNGSFTLNANTPIATETGTWTIVGANYSATLSDIHDPKAIVSDLEVGKKITLNWTINNLACTSNASINITNVIPLTTNSISFSSPDPCSGQLITISGTTPTGGDAGLFLAANYIYSWEIKNSSGGWDLISNNTKDLTNYPVNATFTTRRTVTSNQCSITSNELTINVLPSIVNTITGTQTICYNTIPVMLFNQTVSGGEITTGYQFKWQSSTNVSTGFTDIVGATNMDYRPGALTATTYFRRVVISGTCSNTSSNVVVTVNPNPVVTGLSDKNYCANSPVASISFSSTPGTNTTYRWTNSNISIGLIASGNGALPAFTSSNNTKEPIEATITVTPTYTANAVACDGASATFKITILPNIAINTIADEVVCNGTTLPTFTPVTDAVNMPATATITYRWTVAGSGTNLSNGSGTKVPAIITTNSGTSDLISTITVIPVYNYNGKSCDGDIVNYKITVKPNPSTANAGADAKICVTSYQLDGNNPTVGAGVWTQVVGPLATITNPNIYNTTVTGLQLGIHYEFKWTISNSPCSLSNNDQVNVDVLSTIVNTIKANITTICVGEAITFTSDVLSGGDVPSTITPNYSYSWESSLDGINNWQLITGAASNLTLNPSANIYIRRNVSSYAKCAVTSPAILINVNPPTPTSNAGSDQILCNQAQTTLSANNPGTYIGTWTDITPGGSSLVFTDNHAFNTSINGLVAGKVYNLRWTISGLSPCPDKTDDVNITIRPEITTALAGADQVLCDQTNVNNFITLDANTPLSFETGTWSIVSQPIGGNATIANINNPKSKLNAITPGVYTLKWTISNDANSCTPKSEDIQITVYALPVSGTLTSSTNQVCTDLNSGTLSLSSFTGNIKQWEYSVDNGANWVATTNTSNTLTFTNLTQNTKYRVRVVSNGASLNCSTEVLSNEISVVVDPKSVGGTSTGSTTVCAGTNTGQISLNAFTGTITNWEYSIDNGTTWIALSGSTNQTSITFNNLIKTTIYRAKVQSGVCSLAYSTVSTITVLPPATVAIVQDIEECNVISSQLKGNVAAQGIGTWTSIVGNPNAAVFSDIHDPVSAVSNLIVGTYQFKWTIDNGVCAPSSKTLTLKNYPPIINQIQSTITTICSGQSMTLSDQTHTGGNGTYTYSWQTSSDNLVWSAPIAGATSKDLSIILSDTTYFRRTVSSGPCLLQSNTILINVQAPISNNVINAQADVCIGKPLNSITGALPTGADGLFNYQWQIKNTAGIWVDILNANGQNYLPNALSLTTTFRRLVTSNLCNGAQKSISNEVVVIVRLNAKADFSATKTVSCIPFDLSTVISSTDYVDQNISYKWFANGSSIGTGLNFPGYVMNNDGDSVIIKLVAFSKYGCENDSISTKFATVKNVLASFTKDQIKGCGPLTVNFTNTSTPINGGTYEWDFGNGTTSNLKNPAAITFQPHPLNRDTTYIIKLKAITACFETIYVDSVLVRPKPIAIFSPSVTKGCSPLLVKFNNQSKGTPNKYTFTFGNGDTIVRNDDLDFDYTFLTNKTDTFTVKLVAENECGIDSSFYDIVVFPNTITPELVINGSSSSGCAPLTLNFFNNTEGANSFKWDFDDGTTTTTTKYPDYLSHTFTNPGTYVVKLTGSNGCSTASTTETIIVYPSTTASFSTLKTQYCTNDSVSFINNSPIGNTFLWDFNDGYTSYEVSPKHDFKTAGNYNITLTSTKVQTDGTKCTVITNQVIAILPPPIATFSTNANVLNCSPFTLKVTATPANATAGIEWYFGDPTSTDNFTQGYTANHTYTKAGLYTIKAIAYNQTGCIDSLTQLIRITESPIAEFTPGDSSICGPVASIKFKNTTTYGGTDIVGYRWFINNTLVSSLKDLTYNFNTPSTIILPYKYVIKLVVLTTIGCPDTVSHTIQFNPLPKALFTVSKNIDCAPFKLVIQNKSTFADSYKWYLNGALVSTDFEPKNISLGISNQAYQLKMIAANIYGCKLDSTTQVINTYPKPDASYTLLDSISCNGMLDLKITNKTIGATSYIWNFGDASLESTQTTPAHIYGAPGIYQLRLIASNGFCTDTSITNIRIAQVVNSAFIADVKTGCKTANITFENLSSNAISYLWDFGDGSFSSSKNPTHTFNYQNSPFNVKLIAYGTFGCNDTTIKTKYIDITAPPKADFQVLPDSVIKIPDYNFTFKNTSTGNPISYRWDFGDGTSSTEKDPSHTYADTGFYQVKLTAINVQGCPDTYTKVVKINGVPGYLFVPNAFEPGSEKQSLRTFKLKGSGIAEYSIKIFNKWGALLYESTALDADGSPSESWNGTLNGQDIPQGVYIWNIYAKFINGTVWKGMKYVKGSKITTGSIHLIR